MKHYGSMAAYAIAIRAAFIPKNAFDFDLGGIRRCNVARRKGSSHDSFFFFFSKSGKGRLLIPRGDAAPDNRNRTLRFRFPFIVDSLFSGKANRIRV